MTLANLNQIRERRDIVTYDQRGTGYSNYLLCAPFSSAVGMLLERNQDPAVDAQFETILNDPFIPVAFAPNLCAGMYAAITDVDLGQYNSVASANDISHLAEALGYTEGYDLYGTSYGTRLSQYAMRTTPEQVRSVVLDGALAPSQANATMTFAKRFEQYLNIFAQCAADDACNAAYPNLKERFAALLAKIEANPVVLDPPMVVNSNWTFMGNLPPVLDKIDPSFFVGLAGLSNAYPGGGPANLVPRTILALEEGDLDYVRSAFGATDAPAAALPRRHPWRRLPTPNRRSKRISPCSRRPSARCSCLPRSWPPVATAASTRSGSPLRSTICRRAWWAVKIRST